MGESETKTTFSKFVERVMSAARKRKSNPEQVQEIVKRVYPEKASGIVNLKEIRSKKIIEDAKKVFSEAKATGQHVGVSEWVKANRFIKLDADPEKALNIARQDLVVSLKAAKLPPDNWIVREASHVQCAEAAQALSVVALAPKDVRENPHFLFQTAAQLAGSNSNPEAQQTIKAFITEMNALKGKEGFDAKMFDLRQMLTAEGTGHVPHPGPDFDPALFGRLPRNTPDIFRALNGRLATAATEQERFEILNSFTSQIDEIDVTGFTQTDFDKLSKLKQQRARLEAAVAPHYAKGLDTAWFMRETGVEPFNKEPFQSRGLTESQVKQIMAPPDEDGEAGIDKYIHSMMKRIFSSSREPRSPDLQEQSEYWEIEQLWRHVFGEDHAQAKLAELRSQWEPEHRRNAINWHIVRGGTSNKDLIQKYFESIPPDTMQHEQSILWGPEAIAAYEATTKEFAAEKRFAFDQSRRWFEQDSTSIPGKNRLEALGEDLFTNEDNARKYVTGHGGTFDLDAFKDEKKKWYVCRE